MGEQPKPWMNEPWPSGPLPQGNDCLRIQPDTCVDLTRLRTTPDGVEVKPGPASGGQGGFLDLRYPSHSMPPFREPADLATGVLDAMTRKLRDYDRLSKALTAAQEAATRNLERARLAEDERNSYRAAAESDAKEVDDVRDVLRAASGESAADAARRAARTLFPWPGTVSHPLSASIDRMGGVLKKRPAEAPIDAAVRVMRELDEARTEVGRLRGQRDELEKQRDETGRKLHEATVERDRLFERACKADAARATEEAARDVERNDLRSVVAENDALRKALDDSRALAERLGEAFDCHPGELPRVGRSLSAAMARIAKCVDMVREDEDEVADAVERLREERDLFKQAADAATLGVTPLRAAKPKPKLTPLRPLRAVCLMAGEGARTVTYTLSFATLDVHFAGSNVERWELRVWPSQCSVNYGPHAAASKCSALGDINAVLARHGYVLEAWP